MKPVHTYLDTDPGGFMGLIGVAQVDITPPVGIYSRSWGAAAHDTAEGVHMPLTLTCITFQVNESDPPLVLISADLGVWRNAEDGKKLRSEVVRSIGIPESNMMFCLSHTHAGPVLSTDDADRPGGSYIAPYLAQLQQSAISAIKNAMANAAMSVLTWQYGVCNLATNRDLPDPAKDRFIVGFNPGEKADDTLLVGRIADEAGKIIGTIVNYACHPTTLAWQNRLLSPDFVGGMRQLVQTATHAPCLFLQGASGELAPASQYTGDINIADKNGRQLGFAVMATLESMMPPRVKLSFDRVVESGAPLAVWDQAVFVPSQELAIIQTQVPLTLKDLPPLAEIEQQYHDASDRVQKERLWRKRCMRINLGEGSVINVPLWVWRIGSSLLIGQQNETYSMFQQEIRNKFSSHTIAVMNLVNGSSGYLPPVKLYDKDIYQVWQSPFAAGSLEALIQAAIQTAEQLISKDSTHYI